MAGTVKPSPWPQVSPETALALHGRGGNQCRKREGQRGRLLLGKWIRGRGTSTFPSSPGFSELVCEHTDDLASFSGRTFSRT